MGTPAENTMAEIEIRSIGQTGIRAKALGVGWVHITTVTDEESTATIRRAIELGINYHDTSSMYGDSERRVGLALEGRWRDQIYLQTKVWPGKMGFSDYSGEAARKTVENSLKELRTDHIDSVLVHDCYEIDDALGEGRAFDELHKLKDEGKIGHVGLGIRGEEQHIRAAESGKSEIALTHMDYTLLDQEAATSPLFPALKRHGVGVLIGSPMKKVLAGPEPDPAEAPTAHTMWSWCQQRGLNLRDLALHFCLKSPIGAIVIVGPNSPSQVEENYLSAQADVDSAAWAEFKAEFNIVEYEEE